MARVSKQATNRKPKKAASLSLTANRCRGRGRPPRQGRALETALVNDAVDAEYMAIVEEVEEDEVMEEHGDDLFCSSAYISAQSDNSDADDDEDNEDDYDDDNGADKADYEEEDEEAESDDLDNGKPFQRQALMPISMEATNLRVANHNGRFMSNYNDLVPHHTPTPEQIELQRQFHESAVAPMRRQVEEEYEKTRPLNTQRQYYPKQVQFEKWFRTQFHNSPDDPPLITEDLACVFLEQKVLPKEPSVSLLKAYKSAFKDLWHKQKRQYQANVPEIGLKGGTMDLMIISARKNSHTRKKKHLHNQTDGIPEGYTLKELDRMGSDSFDIRGRHLSSALRDRAMFLANHFFLYRGDYTRRIELSDLCYLPLPPDNCNTVQNVLICLTDQHKTNQVGRVEEVAAIRNKNVEICPVSAMALMLLCRFDLSGEKFPDFTNPADWYNTKLFIANKLAVDQEVTYSCHAKGTKLIYRASNVVCNKSTHNRSCGAKHLALKGVNIENIKAAGRREMSAITDSYLPYISLKAVKVMAGYSSNEGFYLPRASVPLPGDDDAKQRLLQAMFADADRQLKILHDRQHASNNWRLAKNKPKKSKHEKYELYFVDQPQSSDDSDANNHKSRAAIRFLELLISFREVILQDAALLIERHPDLKLWAHPVFHMREFQEFAIAVRQREAGGEFAPMTSAQNPMNVQPQLHSPQLPSPQLHSPQLHSPQLHSV
ncbi:hypothetical protein TRVA0_001S00364 [Trichomonascus vanleenenianus]|uniref:uncharacterized protein n=1 Tax=Trichomonascus vanleenenianus TaxID=2268995 RepID=UPI003ECAEC07